MPIFSSPPRYNFAGNFPNIEIQSNTPVGFRLWEINGDIKRIVLDSSYGLVNSKAVINLRAFFEATVKAKGPTSTSIDISPPLAYQFEIDGAEKSKLFFVLPGGLGDDSMLAEAFLPFNFLTWQPQEQSITTSSHHWLRYMAIYRGKIQARLYYSDGSIDDQIDICNVDPDKIYTIDVSYGSLFNMSNKEKTLAAYDMWVVFEVPGAQAPYNSYTQRYICGLDPVGSDWFVFVNSLGGVDSVCYTGELINDNELAVLSAKTGGVTTNVSASTTETYTKSTGFLPSEESRSSAVEFIRSSDRYYIFNGDMHPIYIIEAKLATKKGEHGGYDFTFGMSRRRPYLNMARTTLPDKLEFKDVDLDGLFFLAPRLEMYPHCEGENIIFPVQQRYGDEWRHMTLTNLRNMIRASESGAEGSYPPERHASTHCIDGKDLITPAGIGAHPEGGSRLLDLMANHLRSKNLTADNISAKRVVAEDIITDNIATKDVITETLSAQDGDIKRLTSEDAHIDRVVTPEVVTPEFLDDMLVGHGFTLRQIKDGPQKGLTELWVDKGFFRHGIETLKLAFNQISITGGEMWVTDGGVISAVEVLYNRFLLTQDDRVMVGDDQQIALMAGNGEQFDKPIVRFTIENPGAKDGALGENSNPFELGDIVMAVVDYPADDGEGNGAPGDIGSGVMPGRRCYMLITEASGNNEYIAVAYDGAIVPVVGMALARWGSTTNPDRQGAVHLSGKSKRVMITDQVDSTVITESNIKVILGRLEGITHSVFGKLKGYGALLMNGYFHGTFILRGSGKSVETAIEAMDDKIELKVEKDQVITSINLTPGQIKINADKIDLNGAVTANSNAGFKKDGTLWGKDADISGRVTASSGQIGPLMIDDIHGMSCGVLQIDEAGSASGSFDAVRPLRNAAGPFTTTGGSTISGTWQSTGAIALGLTQDATLHFGLSAITPQSGAMNVRVRFKAVTLRDEAVVTWQEFAGHSYNAFPRRFTLSAFPKGCYLVMEVTGDMSGQYLAPVTFRLSSMAYDSITPKLPEAFIYYSAGAAVMIDAAGCRIGYGTSIAHVTYDSISLMQRLPTGVIKLSIGSETLVLDRAKLIKLNNLLS